jgi:hypothetical protein
MQETEYPTADLTNVVATLQKHFGQSSQAGFGSSVFYSPNTPLSCLLETEALSRYRYFLGTTWEKLGEQNWLSNWGLVYERKSDAKADIVNELKSISDRNVRLSAGLLLENQENISAATQALQNAFDHPQLKELKVFKLGDGAAMSGLLIVASIHDQGLLSLILLLD